MSQALDYKAPAESKPHQVAELELEEEGQLRLPLGKTGYAAPCKICSRVGHAQRECPLADRMYTKARRGRSAGRSSRQ